MPSLDKFCERMRYWCDEGNLGYDQGNRYDIREGGECDCSSLVIHCLKEAGFDTGNATYTGNMSANLTARGWKRVAPDGHPRKGDILLNDTHHVAAWLGDCLAQAGIDENGRIAGGRSGDQSGRETVTRGYYSYPWNCYLRYMGETDEEGSEDDMKTEALIHIDDAHEGYRKGDIVYWSPEAGFCYLEHPDAAKLVKKCNKGIAELHSSKAAPWVVRAKQATNPAVAAATYGKRD